MPSYFDIDEDGKFVLRDRHTHEVVQRGNIQQLEETLDHEDNIRRSRRRYKCCIRRWFRRKRAA